MSVCRQARTTNIYATRDHGKRNTFVIIEHFAPDAYGLLILAPEIALESGWLGGDRVVGRAAVHDLLNRAARFSEGERQRLTIHLPGRALTLRLDVSGGSVGHVGSPVLDRNRCPVCPRVFGQRILHRPNIPADYMAFSIMM